MAKAIECLLVNVCYASCPPVPSSTARAVFSHLRNLCASMERFMLLEHTTAKRSRSLWWKKKSKRVMRIRGRSCAQVSYIEIERDDGEATNKRLGSGARRRLENAQEREIGDRE